MQKRRQGSLASLILLGAILGSPANAQTQTRISLSQLEQMFDRMRAQTRWDLAGPMLWGYDFFDPSAEPLASLAKELESQGYHTVAIEFVPRKQLYRLHVEKVEVHSPASLDARDQEFYRLAEKYSVRSYDGMDVGPAPH